MSSLQPWLAGVAVVAAVAVGGGAYLVTQSSTDDVAATTPAVTESALVLGVGGVAAKCARPVDPANLKTADYVFEGTVAGLSDGQATLRVTHTFHGDAGDQVQLKLRGGMSEALSGSGEFVAGAKYLITASDGDVADCLSGPADDPSLQASYQDAFPG